MMYGLLIPLAFAAIHLWLKYKTGAWGVSWADAFVRRSDKKQL